MRVQFGKKMHCHRKIARGGEADILTVVMQIFPKIAFLSCDYLLIVMTYLHQAQAVTTVQFNI